jgi:hypothetical protein
MSAFISIVFAAVELEAVGAGAGHSRVATPNGTRGEGCEYGR